MFADKVRVWVRAGKGGAGCVSFWREKFVPDGGPDGGDGGRGGDVVVRVNPHMNNLLHLRYKPHHWADNGKRGGNAGKTGASGKPCILEVPPGTVIQQVPTAAADFERAGDDSLAETVRDLTTPGEEFILCAGGDGGRGNRAFKSSTNRTPRNFEHGHEGERGQFLFILKSIADVGLVGFPNAGKSSLLGSLTSARPKVANYPFTTLEPIVGVLEFPDYQRVTIADIPGIIEGAHTGVGLGIEFLRHIERCRLLLIVLDMASTEGRSPSDDYKQLRVELKEYDPALAKRPTLVVANKSDLPEFAANLKAFKARHRVPTLAISTATGAGLDTLRARIAEHFAIPAAA